MSDLDLINKKELSKSQRTLFKELSRSSFQDLHIEANRQQSTSQYSRTYTPVTAVKQPLKKKAKSL